MISCSVVIWLLVSAYVTKADEISVPIKYGSKEQTLTFPSTVGDAEHMAKTFCVDKGIDAGEELYDSCFDTLKEYLTGAVKKRNKSKRKSRTIHSFSDHEGVPKDTSSTPTKVDILQVTLGIGGSQHTIEYKHTEESSQVAASRFCTDNMKLFGVTVATLHNCIDPVVQQLGNALTKHKASAMHNTTPRRESKQQSGRDSGITRTETGKDRLKKSKKSEVKSEGNKRTGSTSKPKSRKKNQKHNLSVGWLVIAHLIYVLTSP